MSALSNTGLQECDFFTHFTRGFKKLLEQNFSTALLDTDYVYSQHDELLSVELRLGPRRLTFYNEPYLKKTIGDYESIVVEHYRGSRLVSRCRMSPLDTDGFYTQLLELFISGQE